MGITIIILLSSLPARGAWIEIFNCLSNLAARMKSLPARGAWIEIVRRNGGEVMTDESLPARGAWIEIFLVMVVRSLLTRRSPHGERGLKFRHGFQHF